MSRRPDVRRYPVVGGVAAWRVPVLAGLLAAGALILEMGSLAIGAAVVGAFAGGLWRSVVIEVAPAGLTRGLLLRGIFVGSTTVMPWSRVAAVDTRWRRPGDHSILETIVRGADGTRIHFSSAMGLGGYWACLADIVARAPKAGRSGMTSELLAEGPPSRRQALSAAAVAGALALVLVAMAGVLYVLAQGRSSLARYLEDFGAVAAPAPPPGPPWSRPSPDVDADPGAPR